MHAGVQKGQLNMWHHHACMLLQKAAKCKSYTCIIYGTVSAKIAPQLKCYKNASRLNRYNFPTDNAIVIGNDTAHNMLSVVSVPLITCCLFSSAHNMLPVQFRS